ncbi:DegT/DnrJ/EryC1/StrS family aminotransferase [Paraburkholderia azotifigens]|uniref:DegT/DnrJ/EryC1/StrS family aminotransferase n=1 Tax=Paraburkholderia azotifigens TaxID=2057004 RepID=UPI00207DD94A|nr:DegT/DnrJ/EryC1/StrS family aminotransferase [Paraburkholderia hospita]
MQINVTKPFLPPLAEYHAYLEGIWRREWLTNHGPLSSELELRLKEYLSLDYLLYVTNGTIALQLGIKALELTGEIITTPFSYVATTSTIVWENCTPTMVDISPDTLNIDPAKIEQAITDKTSAILATHVFGNPCAIEEIDAIAKKHGLKVIYDAAHAFGTKYHGKSAFQYGDLSATSFHATKLFHTIEGGAVICQSPELLKRVAEMRNFGHLSPTEFGLVGINGKNSEAHAAMGLCNLKYIDEILAKRRQLHQRYKERLSGLPVRFQSIERDCEYNHAYFPVIFESEEILLHVVAALNLNSINPRRYFYPSLSELNYVRQAERTPISNDISRRVLCLPLHFTLSDEEVDLVCRLIHRSLKY